MNDKSMWVTAEICSLKHQQQFAEGGKGERGDSWLIKIPTEPPAKTGGFRCLLLYFNSDGLRLFPLVVMLFKAVVFRFTIFPIQKYQATVLFFSSATVYLDFIQQR